MCGQVKTLHEPVILHVAQSTIHIKYIYTHMCKMTGSWSMWESRCFTFDYVCTYTYTEISYCVHTHAHTHTHTHSNTLTHSHIHTHAHTHLVQMGQCQLDEFASSCPAKCVGLSRCLAQQFSQNVCNYYHHVVTWCDFHSHQNVCSSYYRLLYKKNVWSSLEVLYCSFSCIYIQHIETHETKRFGANSQERKWFVRYSWFVMYLYGKWVGVSRCREQQFYLYICANAVFITNRQAKKASVLAQTERPVSM